jgi:predicted dehydrogenase
MANEPVKFAMIGVTQPHAAGYAETLLQMPEAEIVAGYDWVDLDLVRQGLPGQLREMPLYDDVATLLDRERPEAVVICMPPSQTPALIELAASRGIHIIAEKPCARSATEFLPAADAISKSGVTFSTGFLRHFYPVAIEMRRIIAEGLLGDLMSAEISMVTANVQRRNPEHWFFRREMTGGGVLHWLGCHWIDLINFVTGAEATEVSAILDTLSGEAIDVEDVAAVTLRYDNQMIGSIHCVYGLDKGSDQISIGIRGTKGWMHWDGVGPELTVRSTHPSWSSAPTRSLRFEADAAPGYGGEMGMNGIRQFIASFRDGAPPPFTTADLLRVLDVLDAAEASSASGQRIAVARSAEMSAV